MQQSDIELLLEQLRPQEDGVSWQVAIDKKHGVFASCPITLEIETREVPQQSPVPPPNDVERTLAYMILTNLPNCGAHAKRLLDQDMEPYDLGNDSHLSNPHIWISRKIMELDGLTRWAFVIGISNAPDFGWHVEFDGTTPLEIWAGD